MFINRDACSRQSHGPAAGSLVDVRFKEAGPKSLPESDMHCAGQDGPGGILRALYFFANRRGGQDISEAEIRIGMIKLEDDNEC